MNAMSDTAAQAAIGAAARELRLPTVRAEAARLAEIAARDRATHLAYLAEVLAAELDDRSGRRRARRIADARFPRIKRLADFSTDAVPAITPALLARLAAGTYMDNGEPVVLLGDSGTGKTHLLIGLGLAACEQGRRVRYITTAALVNELVETDGVEATRQITGDPGCAGVKVLILTTFDLDEFVYAALRAGASGFLLKDVPPEELLAAIRVVAAGDALIAPSITRRLIAEFTRLHPASAAMPAAAVLEQITERERQVLALVARGLSNTEIAGALTITHATAKTYLSRLLTKLGARDRAQLVMIAYETRLVTPA